MHMTHWQLPSKGAEANRIRGNRKNVSCISLLAFSNPICPNHRRPMRYADRVQGTKVRGKNKAVIEKMNAVYTE